MYLQLRSNLRGVGSHFAQSDGSLRSRPTAQMLADEITSSQELVEVDAGLYPEPVEEVHDVLGGHVS